MGEKKHSNGKAVTYGSFIRLLHYPTDHMVVGSSDDDPNNEGAAYSNVYFKDSSKNIDETGSLWEVLPRYHLHADGDTVQANDHIVLRSYILKDKILVPVMSCPGGGESAEDLVGLVVSRGACDLQSWQVKKLQHSEAATASHGLDAATGRLRSFMFVRLRHVEASGNLLARSDDAWARGSRVAVLSQIFHVTTVSTQSASSSKVCVRSMAAAAAGEGSGSDWGKSFDQGALSGVWQLLLVGRDEDCSGEICSGDAVRMYHLQSSSFLSCRSVHNSHSLTVSASSHSGQSAASGQEEKHSGSQDNAGQADSGHCGYELCLSPSQNSGDTIFYLHSGQQASDLPNDPHDKLHSTDRVCLLHQATGALVTLADQTRDYHADASQWMEYRYDYPLRLSSFEPAAKEVYEVEVVGFKELSQILYVSKFLPLAKAAVVELQLTDDLTDLFLPLYRHLSVAIYSLIRWVHEQVDVSERLVEHPTDNLVTHGRYSSMGPWVGRGASQFDHRYFRKGIPSDRCSSVSQPVKVGRQDLISDSGILEILLFYTALVYRLMQEQLRRLKGGDGGNLPMHTVPVLLRDCCLLSHDLLEVCCRRNTRNARRILSLHGIGLMMMEQQILGWNVPIDTLLQATRPIDKHGRCSDFDEALFPNNLTQRDIYNVLAQVRILLRQGDTTCMDLLKPLTVIFSQQSELMENLKIFLIDALFGRDIKVEVKKGRMPVGGGHSRLLHRMNSVESIDEAVTSSHQQRRGTEAPLMFFATNKVKDKWQVKFGNSWTCVQPDDSQDHTEERMQSLQLLWRRIVSHSGALSASEAAEVLQLLGVPATMIIRGTQELVGKTYQEFLAWWELTSSDLSPRYIFESGTVNSANISQRLIQTTFSKVGGDDTSSCSSGDGKDEDFESVREWDSDDDSEYTDDDDPDDVDTRPTPAMADIVLQLLHNAKKRSTNKLVRMMSGSRISTNSSHSLQQTRSSADFDLPNLLASVLGVRRYESAAVDDKRKRVSLRRGETVQRAQSFHVVTMERNYRRASMMQKIPGFDIGAESKPRARTIIGQKSTSSVESEVPLIDVSKELELMTWHSTQTLRTSWIDVDDLLRDESFERALFEEIVALVCVLCDNHCLHAQLRACRPFPVSFVLHILENGKRAVDRAVACSLLRVLYVQHDFVSPLSILVPSDNSECYGLQESGHDKSMEWAVFNKATRHPQAADMSTTSGRSLRFVLSRIVKVAFNSVYFTTTLDGDWVFVGDFLELLDALMRVGFMDSSSQPMSLFQADETRIDQLTTWSIGWSLVAKLQAFLAFLRSESNDDKYLRMTHLTNYINKPESGLLLSSYHKKRLQLCLDQGADVR